MDIFNIVRYTKTMEIIPASFERNCTGKEREYDTMMRFNFYNPTNLIFGSGSLNELGSQEMPGKKAMLLISNGKSTKVNGSLDT